MNQKARTTKEIYGNSINTIPVGTEFEITSHNEGALYSACCGLDVTLVYNDEFELIQEG